MTTVVQPSRPLTLGRRATSERNLKLRLFALTILALVSIVILEHTSRMDAPFTAFFFVASAWAIAFGLLCRREALHNGALTFSSILFSLAVVEVCFYYTFKSAIIVTKTYPEEWRRNAANLGSMPVPNTATNFKEFLDGRLLADVTYRIDSSGLREITASVQGRPHKAAFFGCSFMFGHGVENDQTLPYYFVQEAGRTYEGFNFAGEGWGPHQMLREIETGFVRRVAGAPDLAIYEAIPDHLRRVAGRAPWEDGPKYEMCRGDKACYSGPFHSAAYQLCRRWLSKSWIVKVFENCFAELSRPSDIPLLLAVLRRTRTLLEENGTRFVIVLWDQNDLGRSMIKTLRANHFDVVALSSIVPDSDTKSGLLTQQDRHPSPATNKAIATYLWKQIGKPLVDGEPSR